MTKGEKAEIRRATAEARRAALAAAALVMVGENSEGKVTLSVSTDVLNVASDFEEYLLCKDLEP